MKNTSKQSPAWVTALRGKIRLGGTAFPRMVIIVSLFVFAIILTFGILFFVRQFSDPITGIYDIHTISYGIAGIILVAFVLCGIVLCTIVAVAIQRVREHHRKLLSLLIHELRTPLSILKMNNENALYGRKTPSPMTDVLNENIDDVENLNVLLENVLLLDQFHNTRKLEMEAIETVIPIRHAVDRMQHILRSHDGRITIAGTACTSVIWGDRVALEQVCMILLRYSIANAHKNVRVTISKDPAKPSRVVLEITNADNKNQRDQTPQQFTPFYDSSYNPRPLGAELELATAYEIIRLHHGTLDFVGEKTRGTTFILSFPRV